MRERLKRFIEAEPERGSDEQKGARLAIYKSFHVASFNFRDYSLVGLHASGFPPQQFSVKYAAMPFVTVKFAAS
jgi:hypothetical protein